jgi:hypothetical protein
MSLNGVAIAQYVPRSAVVTCFGKQKHDTRNWTSLGVNKSHCSQNVYVDRCFIRSGDTVRLDTTYVM